MFLEVKRNVASALLDYGLGADRKVQHTDGQTAHL